jgi:maleate isomerase
MNRALLGILTPSSNTVLEPVTCDMIRGIPEASAHFGRFAVTHIALSADSQSQFATPEVLKAAELLSHAKCQVIGWSGTSSSWLGFGSDQKLCNSIQEATGAQACTSVLAINEILELTGARKLALVSPYLESVQLSIIQNYQQAGFDMVAEQHKGLQDNYSFSEVTGSDLSRMVHEVAKSKPDAILIMCTNLRGAPLVEQWEKELGIPVYDSVSTVIWKSLRLAGIDTRRVQGWGRLFSEVG